eukprot:TRINITY_DN1948_c0_g1_i3.p2 TRINITY_DN1948_c0_g1~~TRINITY_DN1948_c0_g1_i3.p2  ORF type:complete len:152 (+),score=52.45 TRINITY_DN1948_c0_g1_i3:305-760(+)
MCVRNCLEKAEEHGFSSIAMPAISSGIFGFPKELCASIMFDTVLAFFEEKAGHVKVTDVHFTNFDEITTQLFEAEAARRQPKKAVVVAPASAEQTANAEAAVSVAESMSQADAAIADTDDADAGDAGVAEGDDTRTAVVDQPAVEQPPSSN